MQALRIAYLLIKIKSLSAEAVIIRHGERRWRRTQAWATAHALPDEAEGARCTRLGLAAHRRGDVRSECRAALLAYGYLRGRPYRGIEAKCHEAPAWDRVTSLIRKYGPDPKVSPDAVRAWGK